MVASKFPNGSCGSAPTVNMTNTYEEKKKKKSERTSPQNTKIDAIPFSEFEICKPAQFQSWLDPDLSRCFGPDRLDSAIT